ncbi:hypothetical protein BU251_01210 [Candidatus Velamenicoccus archaeovorus]|uniref:Uncharacterized protein n=2 Tax=Velamenicoccus archaeovorus TaxID=1930593 RepID=A0A410P2X1_VELA1|nr:hypothetical protein BU251_01210 [Candidatus Velamenicoccus archaeovorus]
MAVAACCIFWCVISPAGCQEEASVRPPEPEARQWLRQHDDDVCFRLAGQCTGPQNAPAYIKKLYMAGAIFVGVVFSGEEPVGLRVYLPVTEEKREEVFETANVVFQKGGYGVLRDEDQDAITIWF